MPSIELIRKVSPDPYIIFRKSKNGHVSFWKQFYEVYACIFLHFSWYTFNFPHYSRWKSCNTKINHERPRTWVHLLEFCGLKSSLLVRNDIFRRQFSWISVLSSNIILFSNCVGDFYQLLERYLIINAESNLIPSYNMVWKYIDHVCFFSNSHFNFFKVY